MHVDPSEVSVISMPTVNLFYLQIRGEKCSYSNKSFIIC